MKRSHLWWWQLSMVPAKSSRSDLLSNQKGLILNVSDEDSSGCMGWQAWHVQNYVWIRRPMDYGLYTVYYILSLGFLCCCDWLRIHPTLSLTWTPTPSIIWSTCLSVQSSAAIPMLASNVDGWVSEIMEILFVLVQKAMNAGFPTEKNRC